MKSKLLVLGLIAGAAGFAACETNTPTNVNRAANNSNGNVAVVSNTNTNTIVNTNTNSNANRSSINYNGTAKDNEARRTDIEAEAKRTGSTIGQGAEDWWLWSKTRAALAAENELKDSTINVDVENSVITLKGEVRNQAEVKKADAVAKTIEGQKGVKNTLKVNPNASMTTTNTNTANTNKK